jgi:molecular chaperone DnaK (HSP70)
LKPAVNALNIRSFVYEFEAKWFSKVNNLETRKEKYTALAKKKTAETLKIYNLTETLIVDFIMQFYKYQCESAHPEFNINSVITIPEGFSELQRTN